MEDPGIRLYVVWEAIHPVDTEKSAVEASGLLADDRVVQYWASQRFTSNARPPREYCRAPGPRLPPLPA